MLIKQLKELVDNKIKLSPTYKDDYEPSFDELKNGKVCQTWVKSSNILLCRDGILTEGESVSFVYVSEPNIQIIAMDNIVKLSKKNPSLKIKVCGNFKIIKKNEFGDSVIFDETISLPFFKLEITKGKNFLSIKDKDTIVADFSKWDGSEGKIVASYYFKGKKCLSDEITVRLSEEEPILETVNYEYVNSLELSSDKNFIPSDGGQVKLKVVGNITFLSVTYDEGEEVHREMGKKEEDVTNKCKFTLSNDKHFSVVKGVLKAYKNTNVKEEKVCSIVAEYSSAKSNEIEVSQRSARPNSRYILEIVGNDKIYVDASCTKVKIPFVSKVEKFFGNEIIDTLKNNSVRVVLENDDAASILHWNEAEIVFGKNFSRDKEKRINGYIESTKTNEKAYFEIIQEQSKIVETEYFIEFNGNGIFDKTSNSNEPIRVSIKQITTYSSDIKDITYNVGNDLRFNEINNGSFSNIYYDEELEGYFFKYEFTNTIDVTNKNVSKIVTIVDDKGNLLSKPYTFNGVYIAPKLSDYNYDFSVDRKRIVWQNGDEIKFGVILVNSLMTLGDGEPMLCGFDVLTDGSFDIEKHENSLIISPLTKHNIKRKITIVQKYSKKQETITLETYFSTNISHIELEVTCDLNGKYDDVYTKERPKIEIMDNTNIVLYSSELRNFWFNKSDLQFNDIIGDFELAFNDGYEYLFRVYGTYFTYNKDTLTIGNFEITKKQVLKNNTKVSVKIDVQ